MPKQEIPAVLAGLVAAMLVSGCGRRTEGPPRVAASGTVTLDGEPLPEGVIRFVPIGETKGPKASTTIEEGTFAFPKNYGPVPGTHRIEIEATEADLPDPDDEAAVQAHLATRKQRKPAARIPPAYNQHSELTEEISPAGTNEFRFDLVSRR